MRGLQRFIEAQKQDFSLALEEVRSGQKKSHWMWYIFPQLRGLGFSSRSDYYGIQGLEEARDFLRDPYLGENLRRICQALLELETADPSQIFGSPDDRKLLSCMTLFEAAEGKRGIFSQVIEKFYGGKRDQRTWDLLREQEPEKIQDFRRKPI